MLVRVLEVQGGDVTAQQEQDTTSGHLEIRGQHEVRDAPRIQRIHGMPDELAERGIYPGDAQVRRNQQHPASGGIDGDAEHLDITGLRVSRLRLALQLDVGRRQLLAALLQRLVEARISSSTRRCSERMLLAVCSADSRTRSAESWLLTAAPAPLRPSRCR